MLQRVFNTLGLPASDILSLRLSLLVLVLIYCLYRYVQRRRESNADTIFGEEHGCQPIAAKYPCKWPLGLDVLSAQHNANAEKRLLSFQQPFLDDLGPNLELKILGTVRYTTFDPKNVEAVLSSRFEDYNLGSRRGALFPFIGEGIFTQDGARWKHSRELLRRPFLNTHYQDLKGFAEPINSFLAKISSSSAVIDCSRYSFALLWLPPQRSSSVSLLKVLRMKNRKNFASSFDYASLISVLRMRLQDFYWAYRPSRYTAACRNVKDYADGFVKRALLESNEGTAGRPSDRYAFIEDLYDEFRDPVLVRDQLINVLLAGRDTTACLLSWVFFLLVRHPKALNRLRDDIQSVMGNEAEMTRVHVKKLAYLKYVLNETLRLYHQIPINARFAQKTTCLPQGGGPDGSSPVLVRRGLGVAFLPYYRHRRKDLYGDDAMEFRPERWERPELGNIGWAYLPFHGGSRLCLGKDFALMEASCAIIRILQEFPNLRLPPEVPVVPTGQEKQELTVFLKSADGCKVLVS